MPSVERASGPKPTDKVQAMPGAAQARVSQPAIEPKAAPEPAKRTKAEKVHEGRGYYLGLFHGVIVGLGVGLFAMWIGFNSAATVTSDLAAKLDATRVARDAALGGR